MIDTSWPYSMSTVAHVVCDIPGQLAKNWSPICRADDDFPVAQSEARDVPTCFWCVCGITRYRDRAP